jgi:hypothetical protein
MKEFCVFDEESRMGNCPELETTIGPGRNGRSLA